MSNVIHFIGKDLIEYRKLCRFIIRNVNIKNEDGGISSYPCIVLYERETGIPILYTGLEKYVSSLVISEIRDVEILAKRGVGVCNFLNYILYETQINNIHECTISTKVCKDKLTAQSHRKVWWRCEKGHEWERSVHGRANNSGCPYCSGRFAIKGETDLATVNAILAKEWHPTKNGDLKPEDVTAKSSKKVWWQCGKGHEWNTSISSRNINGCPFCSGRSAIKGEKDLATVNFILAEEWHPTKNGDLKPDDVTARSAKKIWWLCEKGHEWRAVINMRANGTGCPECRRNKSALA